MKEVLSLGLDPYHSPAYCSKCGGVMIFRGVGEYRCEDCGNAEDNPVDAEREPTGDNRR